MTLDEMVEKVIVLLQLTPYHKDIVSLYVEDGIFYLKGAGVNDEVIYSNRSLGVLTTYVNDNWNYNQGQSKISPSLKERVIQLSMIGDDDYV